MKKYVISIIILLILIVLAIGGFFIYSNIMNNKSNDSINLSEKCMSELEFMDTSIIEMLNGLNNISYTNYRIINEEINVASAEQENSTDSKNTINSTSVINNDILSENNNDINWNDLKSEMENMYDSWTTILIDLTT